MRISKLVPILKKSVVKNASTTFNKSIVVCLEGDAGIGKTSISQHLSNNNHVLNLANLDSIGDLMGNPYVMFQTNHGLVPKELLTPCSIVSEIVTKFSRPSWLSHEPMVLVVDDFSRATTVVLQSFMNTLLTGMIGEHKIPDGSTIVLSSNPNDGDMFVTELDDAQATRFVKLNVTFNFEDWALNAEGKLPNEWMEFFYANRELLNPKGKVNPRLWEKVINLISILDINDDKFAIQEIIETNINTESALLFYDTFLSNRKNLPQPNEIINQGLSYYESLSFTGGDKILIETRVMNYGLNNLSTVNQSNFVDIICSNKFAKDIFYSKLALLNDNLNNFNDVTKATIVKKLMSVNT